MLKNSDGSSVYVYIVSPVWSGIETGQGLTKTTTRNRVFLAKLVISLSQFVIAENLIRFADLIESLLAIILARG